MTDLVPVLVGVGVLASLEALFHLARHVGTRREAELRRRLGLLSEGTSAATGLLRRERYASNPAIEALVRALPGATHLERLLAQADARWSVAQLLAGSLASACAAAFCAAAIGAPAPASWSLALLCALVPPALFHRARVQRSRLISEQLPEGLDMMCRSLRAGHALPAAFRFVASELPLPLGIEFARACEEQAHGLAPETAVMNMTTRTPLNGDLKHLAVSVSIQRETGGNLAEILEKLATTIRDRARFRSKVRALTAEGRTSGLVLAALPVAMLLLMAALRPRYAVRLIDNDFGRVIFAGACLAWLAGLVWLHRMAQVEL